MIIDIHMHIFPDEMAAIVLKNMSASSNVLPAGLATRADAVAALRCAGCDLGVLQPVATTPHSAHANRFTAANDNLPLLWFGAIHPDTPQPERLLDEIKALGAKGIKLHPQYQRADIDDPRMVRLVRLAAARNLAVLFHAGWDPAFPEERCTTAKIINLIEQVEGTPGLVLIAAHLGGLDYYDETERLLCGRDIYFDTAIIGNRVSPEQYCRIIDKHGYQKVLFGSDYPWQSPTDSLHYLRALNLPQEQEQAILGGNAARLFGLES